MEFSNSEEEFLLRFHPLTGNAEEVEDLRKRYSEKGRFYHTWGHALSVLSWVDFVQYEVGFEDHTDARLAALYHDVIYDVSSRTNEADSARYFKKVWSKIVHAEELSGVTGLINLTAKHSQLSHESELTLDEAHFLDCDMAFMYAEPRFDLFHYMDGLVKLEYMQVFSKAQVLAGRKSFLEGLLKRGIFLSPLFKDHFEDQAQVNLRRLLERHY